MLFELYVKLSGLLTNYICEDTISKKGPILKFWMDMNFWVTLFNLVHTLYRGKSIFVMYES